MPADLPTLRPEFEKLLKETAHDKFMRLAREIVPKKDWKGFVFSAMLFGSLKRDYPQYFKEIERRW